LTADTHAIVVADTKGRIRAWNDGAQALFGYSTTEAIGSTLDLLVPEAFRERHWLGFRSVMAGGAPRLDGAGANLPVLCRSGDVVHFPGKLSVLRDARGEIAGALAVYRPAEGTNNGLYTLDVGGAQE
jgi:PAS domain S-box-containing protein